MPETSAAPLGADGGGRIGLAISTIGRPGLHALLRSAADSTHPPAAVAVANQSGHPLQLPTGDLPFPVTVQDSTGGVSRGRNEAAAALGDSVDVLGFPNDDSAYPPETLAGVRAAFASAPVAVACRLVEPAGARFALPAVGTALDRRTVWRAIEPATFVARAGFAAADGFRTDMGAGSGAPWGSGEGTDLLLRLLAAGGTVLSRPDLAVLGPGERRDLRAAELVAKHRAYARGTGYVYRTHRYPLPARLRVLAGPLVKALQHDPSPALSLRLALARTAGRIEGLRGSPFRPGR